MVTALAARMLEHHFVRYSISAGIGLVFKLVMTAVLERLAPGNFYLNYLVVHVLVVFLVFYSHSIFTFASRPTLRLFASYVQSVLAFKVVDYAVTLLLVYSAFENQQLAIVVSAGIVHVLRYLVVKLYVFRGRRAGTSPGEA